MFIGREQKDLMEKMSLRWLWRGIVLKYCERQREI